MHKRTASGALCGSLLLSLLFFGIAATIGATGASALSFASSQPSESNGTDNLSAGEIDPTFQGPAADVATFTVLPDGKIIVTGSIPRGDGTTRSVARLNQDGTIDPAFNAAAITNGEVGGVRSLAVQADGKVLIGGDFFVGGDNNTHIGVARLNVNGSLDSSFTRVVLNEQHSSIQSLALQPDGRVLIAGFWFQTIHGAPRQGVARLNPDGTLDQSFVAAAEVPINIYQVALQPDGRVLVGHKGHKPVTRLNSNGALDTSFNTASMEANTLSGEALAYAMALQPDGKLLFGGELSHVGGVPRRYFARLNHDGSLDLDFNPTFEPYAERVLAITLQLNGKVLVGYGRTENYRDGVDALNRYNKDGSEDTSFTKYKFDRNGYVAGSGVNEIGLQPDGKIIISGLFDRINDEPHKNMARLAGDPIVDTPRIDIEDLYQEEGNRYEREARLRVTLSDVSAKTVTVKYTDLGGTADANDYESRSGTLTFAPGETEKLIVLPVHADPFVEENEFFTIRLSDPVNATIGRSEGKVTIFNDDTLGGQFQFSTAFYVVTEGDGHITITVTREGDNKGAASVDYYTEEVSASSRRDYATARGTLSFAEGEQSKTFIVLITQDSRVEGSQHFRIVLENPTGQASLGEPAVTGVNILDDVPEQGGNPIDDARNFVRQQYHDFLGREPDQAGWDFWTANITKCANAAQRAPGQTAEQCVDRQRTTTSAAFFLSPEFQYTGGFALRVYMGSLGRFPNFLFEFTRDIQELRNGIMVNNRLSAEVIEANRAAFLQRFVESAGFKTVYEGLNNEQYVNKLFQTTGVQPSEADRAALVNGLNQGTETRAGVLRKIVDGTIVLGEGQQQFTTTYGKAFYDKIFNQSFVQMEYFGYLQRDPDEAGYQHWLGKLNHYGNYIDAEMVRSFLVSTEYRMRFQ